uniref:Chondroitin proteoglycan 4 domain-containing protein n=1 Tax=Parascaris univalens TaxID=6257 RepID=A0A915BBE4_PARUN
MLRGTKRLFLFFLLTLPINAKKLSQQRYGRLSPLDMEYIPSNKTMDSYIGINSTKTEQEVSNALTHEENMLTIAGIELPDCFKGCNDYFFKAIDVAIKSGNNYERFQNVCHRFVEARRCLDKLKHCGNYELFDVLTSGMKYMCIDQKDAFNATVECVDVNTAEIQERCSKDCNVEGILAGWGVYAGLRQTALFTPASSGNPSKLNVIFFRKITTEGCQVIQCYLTCMRSKFNARCSGMAGSLLSEVIFRPISMGHNLVVFGPALNFVRLVLPVQCNFVLTKAGIDTFRIDEKLDVELKKAYSMNRGNRPDGKIDKRPPKPEEVPDPWKKYSDDDMRQSPLETDTVENKYETFDFHCALSSRYWNLQFSGIARTFEECHVNDFSW